MELDFDKLISWKNADKAVVGNRYYYFDEISPGDLDSVENNPVGILNDKNNTNKMNSFLVNAEPCSFLYPYEEEKRYLTYEELKKRWVKNPTELYRYKDKRVNIIGMITYFDDGYYTCYLGDYAFTEDVKNISDTKIIRNITDINGNPLLKE